MNSCIVICVIIKEVFFRLFVMIWLIFVNYFFCVGEWFDFDVLVEGDNIVLVIDCDCFV